MRLKFFSALGERGIPDGLLEIVLWAVIGGSLGSTALSFVGGTPGVAIAGGFVAAACAAAIAHAWRETQTRIQLERTLANTRREMVDLIERQARSDAKMGEIERRTIESPALVWRAATEDIEALSGLVSRLATAVADHDQRLNAVQAAQAAASRAEASPAPAPALERAEPPRAVLKPVEAPPAAVIAELKTTLAAALASDRLELYLEPVAALPQRSIKGYEATLRLKGVPPEEADLRRVATATGLRADLDRLLVERAAQVLRILRARNREATALCRIGGESLTAEPFRAALDALGRSDSALSAAVTLEIAEAEYEALDTAGREAMSALAEKGFTFSLCELDRLRPTLAEAGTLGVNRLRIAADELLRAQTADGSDIHPADVPEYLRRRGLELMVTGIETEQTVLDLLEVAAPLAMGPLFGVARPVRPEILEPKAVQSGTPPADGAAEEPSAAPRPRRQSFRSVLRRA